MSASHHLSAARGYYFTMKYPQEFLKAVLGNVVLDIAGVVLVFAGFWLASWMPAVALALVLLYASFRAFSEVATERDQLAQTKASNVELANLLAGGRNTAQRFQNELNGVITLAAYDAVLKPIEEWWRDFSDALAALNRLIATQVGLFEDIDPARRPIEARQGLMDLGPLRGFLQSRIDQISTALNNVE